MAQASSPFKLNSCSDSRPKEKWQPLFFLINFWTYWLCHTSAYISSRSRSASGTTIFTNIVRPRMGSCCILRAYKKRKQPILQEFQRRHDVYKLRKCRYSAKLLKFLRFVRCERAMFWSMKWAYFATFLGHKHYSFLYSHGLNRRRQLLFVECL